MINKFFISELIMSMYMYMATIANALLFLTLLRFDHLSLSLLPLSLTDISLSPPFFNIFRDM